MVIRRVVLLAAALVLLCGNPTQAEQGDTETGFRLIWDSGGTSSRGTVADTGSEITLASGPGVEVNWAFSPLDRLAIELSAGASAHSVGTSGGAVGGLDGGTLWRFPLSAVAQYRFALFSQFKPYAGLGLVYNLGFYDMSSEYEEWLSKVSFSNEIALVAQIGTDYTLNERWTANLDLRFMGMSTTGTFEGLDGTVLSELDFKMDPWVIALGFRYRY
jgi:outer membrane protein W